jgi:hypothetical protein
VRVHFAAEHALELEAAHALFEAGRIPLDVLRRGLVVLAFSQIEQLGRIRDRLAGAIELGELGSELGALAAQLLRLVRLLPDRRIL